MEEKGQMEQRLVRLDGRMKSLHFVWMSETRCHWVAVVVHAQVSTVQQFLNKMRDNKRLEHWLAIIQIGMNSPMQPFHDAELAKMYSHETFLSHQQKLQMQEWPHTAAFCVWYVAQDFI